MSLVELLVSCAITAVIAFSTILALRTGTQAAHRIEVREQSLVELSRLESILQAELARSQSLSSFRGYRLHPAARVTRSDGTPLQLRNFSPAPDSDAITIVRPRGELILRRKSADGFCAETLVDSPEIVPPSAYKSFLALGAMDVQQLTGKLSRQAPGFSGCPARESYRAALGKDTNAVFVHPDVQPLLLVPIEDLFTFYLDSGHLLRRISHVSGASQAVAGPFEKFSLNPSADGTLLEVHVRTEARETAGRIERVLLFPVQSSALSPLDLAA